MCRIPKCTRWSISARLISELGYAKRGSIGVEMENYYFSAKAWETLKANLPDASFLDATSLINWQRIVKSQEELVFIRRAAKISEKMIDGVMERVEPGLKKNELVADIFRDQIMGADGHWGDYASIAPLAAFGRGRFCGPPDLGRPRIQKGRSHLL